MAGARVSAGETGKEVFEDLMILGWAAHDCKSPGAPEALERVLNRMLRALANPGGITAEGMRQGLTRHLATCTPLRDAEAGK